jgi:hypothetical protein
VLFFEVKIEGIVKAGSGAPLQLVNSAVKGINDGFIQDKVRAEQQVQ